MSDQTPEARLAAARDRLVAANISPGWLDNLLSQYGLAIGPGDLDGKPFCRTGYAQRYHAIGECDCADLALAAAVRWLDDEAGNPIHIDCVVDDEGETSWGVVIVEKGRKVGIGPTLQAAIEAAKEASVTDQTPEARSETSVWMVDFEVTAIEMHGHEWPDVLVQKWERNEMGERRFVESRIYKAAKEAERE